MNDNIPILGIPHYNRADLTARCINSIDHPVDRLVLILNHEAPGDIGLLGEAVLNNPHVYSYSVLRHPNAGVAGSWNEVIKLFPSAWWLITNNDIEFARGDLWRMAEAVRREALFAPGDRPLQTPAGILYGNHGASWFAISAYGVYSVGLFDENIYPAYLEDCDWSYRADLLKVRRVTVPGMNSRHGDDRVTGSATIQSDPVLREKNGRTHGGNFEYYIGKWGGRNGEETYQTPFNNPAVPVWAWRFNPGIRMRQQW